METSQYSVSNIETLIIRARRWRKGNHQKNTPAAARVAFPWLRGEEALGGDQGAGGRLLAESRGGRLRGPPSVPVGGKPDGLRLPDGAGQGAREAGVRHRLHGLREGHIRFSVNPIGRITDGRPDYDLYVINEVIDDLKTFRRENNLEPVFVL